MFTIGAKDPPYHLADYVCAFDRIRMTRSRDKVDQWSRAMQEPIQDQIKSFSEEKFKALAEKNDWPLGYARGYVEGERRRRSGEPAPRVALIGIDQYALGFRTGFFERRNPDSTRPAVLETRQLRRQA